MIARTVAAGPGMDVITGKLENIRVGIGAIQTLLASDAYSQLAKDKCNDVLGDLTFLMDYFEQLGVVDL